MTAIEDSIKDTLKKIRRSSTGLSNSSINRRRTVDSLGRSTESMRNLIKELRKYAWTVIPNVLTLTVIWILVKDRVLPPVLITEDKYLALALEIVIIMTRAAFAQKILLGKLLYE